MIKKLLKSPFGKNVAVLSGATVFAQGLGVLALPFLTRLYTPGEFGVLGAFTALLGLFSVVSALRYEIAIPLPETDQDAQNLLLVSLISVAGISALAVVAIIYLDELILTYFSTPELTNILWLLPIAVFLTGGYAVFQYWALRKNAYQNIARIRIEQALGGIGCQLVFGCLGSGATGLVAGQIISNGLGFFGLARRAWTDGKQCLVRFKFSSLGRIAYIYRRFPIFSTTESFANIAGLQIPLLLIVTIAGNQELGYLVLVMRILEAPMSVVGRSIAQVYYGQAGSELKINQLLPFTVSTLRKLFTFGFPLFLLIAVLAPWVTPLAFGAAWARAGELIIWMMPSFFIQFLSSPISMSLHVIDRQKAAMSLQIAGLLIRVFSVLFFPDIAVEAFAISSALFYAIYVLVILFLLMQHKNSSAAFKLQER